MLIRMGKAVPVEASAKPTNESEKPMLPRLQREANKARKWLLKNYQSFLDWVNTAPPQPLRLAAAQVVAIVVVYNNLYFLEDAGNVGVETSQPIVTVESAKVPGVAHGDVITIESENYNVVGVRPDGTGITELVLEKQ